MGAIRSHEFTEMFLARKETVYVRDMLAQNCFVSTVSRFEQLE